MPKSDDLKNRLDELFSSSQPGAEAGIDAVSREAPAVDAGQTNAALFNIAFENISVGMVVTGLDTRFLRVNEAFARMLGFEREELEGLSFQAVTFADDISVGAKTMKALISGERNSAKIQKRCLHKDGRPVWVDLSITLLRDAEDKPLHLVTIVQDISDQKRTARLEVRESRESLSEVSELQTAILENAGYAIIATTPEGLITVFNPAAEQMLGYSAKEMVGRQTPAAFHDVDEVVRRAQLFSEELGYTIEPGFEVFVAKSRQGLPNEYEWTYIRKDGTRFPVMLSVTALRAADGEITGFLGMASDISERERTEGSLTRRVNELATVAEVSTAAATILRPEELLHTVVQLTKERFDLYHAHVYLLNEAKDTLMLASGVGEAGKKMVARGWQIPFDSERSLVARSAREQKGVIVNDVRSEPDFLPNELLPDTAAEMAIPLVVGNELLGVLDVQSDQAGYFTDQDVTIYTTLAYQVAVALQNARQHERTQQALTAAETLYAGSAWIASANSMEKILQALVGATSLKKLDRANIFIFDRSWQVDPPKAVTVAANWEKRGRVSRVSVGTTYPLSNLPVLPLLNREQPTIIADAQTDMRLGKELRSALSERGVQSLAIFPLKASGEWIGAVVGEAVRATDLHVEEIRRINSLMDQAATVAQNLRLIEQTRQAQGRAQTILDSVTTPMLISMAADGQIVYANSLLADVVRVPLEHLVGKPTPDFYVDLADRQKVVGQIREQGAVSNYEVRLKRSDGDEFWALLSAQLIDYEGSPAIITSLLDVTDRKLAEEELRRTAEELDRIFSSSLDLIGAANFDGYFISLNPACEKTLGYTREELMARPFIEFAHPDDVEMTTAETAKIAKGAQILAFENRYRCKDGSYKWISWRATPDLEHGVIHFIARDVTESKQAEETLAKRLRELQVTSQVAEYIRIGGGLEATLEKIIAAVIGAFGADNAVFSNFDHETQTWHGVVGAGEGMTTEIAKTFSDPGLAYPHGMEAVHTGQVVAVDDAKTYPDFPEQYIEIIGIKSVLVMPVFSGGVVSGVIFFNWNTRQHTFNDEEIALARGLSDQISTGIESQHLFDQAQIRARRLATVAEVSTTAATVLEPTTLLQSVVDLTKESFELYHAHIYLLDEAGRRLVLAAGAFEVGRMMVAQGWEIPLDSERSLVARAARERQGVIVNDVRADPDFLPNDLLPETASEMAVPLIAGEQILGVLDVQSDRVDFFSQEDVNIQTTLASQVAVALQNARQYEQTQIASFQLGERVKELNCLSDIGHKMDERPPIKEFLAWVAERVPSATQYPDICVAAIEYGDQVYGHERAVELPDKMVAGLRVTGELVGWVHIAYTEARDFLDEESALIGGVASRVSSYIESQNLIEQTRQAQERVQTILDAVTTPMLISKVSDGQIVYANELLAGLVKVPMEELDGKATPNFYVDLDDRQKVVGQIREKGAVSNYELRLRRSDGVEFWGLLSARLLDFEGEPAIITSLIDVTDRKQVEEALRESQEDLQTLIEYAPEAIVVVDLDTGLFIEPNENAVRLYGLSREELVEVGPAEMSPPFQPDGRPSTEKAMEYLAEAMQGGVPVFDWMHRNSAGQDIPCEVRLVRLPVAGRKLARASVTDITARKEAEERLSEALAEAERQARSLTLLNQMAADIGAAVHEREVLQIATNRILGIVGGEQASLALLEPGEDEFSIYASGGSDIIPLEMNLPIEGTGVGKAIRERRMLVTPQDASLDDFMDTRKLAAEGIRATMSIPLFVGGNAIGAFIAGSTSSEGYSQREQGLMGQVGALVASAIENRRLIDAIQARVRREQALREITANVRGSINTDAILRTAVRELGDTLGRKAFVRLGSAEELAHASKKQVDREDGSDGHSKSRSS